MKHRSNSCKQSEVYHKLKLSLTLGFCGGNVEHCAMYIQSIVQPILVLFLQQERNVQDNAYSTSTRCSITVLASTMTDMFSIVYTWKNALSICDKKKKKIAGLLFCKILQKM